MSASPKEHVILLSVIEMYKNMPYLWKKDHKDYTNKTVREGGYKLLLEKYKDFDENATMKTMKKKIDNLRTNYFKEYKKMIVSQRSEDEEDYVPTLWYFNLFHSFLHDSSESEQDPLINVKVEYETSRITRSCSPKRKTSRTSIERRGFTAPEARKIFTNFKRKEEPWEVYGKAIGLDVKDISGPQLVICKKIISDAIFYAKLNKLNDNSHIVNPETEHVVVEYLESD